MPTSGLPSRRSQRCAPSCSGRRWADDSYDFTVRAERSSPLRRDHDPVRYDDRRVPALTTAAPLAVALAPASGQGLSRRIASSCAGAVGANLTALGLGQRTTPALHLGVADAVDSLPVR